MTSVATPALLALVDAVEAAQHFIQRMGMGTASAQARLEDALAQFDFEDGLARVTGSAMADMSRAIREQSQQHGATLRDLPDDVLRDYVLIVGAYYADLSAEAARRQLTFPR